LTNIDGGDLIGGTMELHPVQSSNVEAIGYDPATETLEVKFKGGTAYRYNRVPREIWAKLYEEAQEGGSVGRFIALSIKGQFEAVKV
jgi:hypothetical protein